MFDAVIVGLGPTGATMANLLAMRGWTVAVLERTADVYDKPRAITADHEALRVFQQIGLADEIAAGTTPHRGTDFLGLEGQLIKKFYPADPPGPLGWDPSFMFLQPELERILRAGLRRFDDVTVLLSTELVGIDAAADHVVVRVHDEDTGAQRELRARYVLGCDGASSTVRRLMSGTFEDLEFDEQWLVLDAIVAEPDRFPQRCIQYCRPWRPGTYIVGPGDLRRWEIKMLPGEGPSTFTTEESVQAVLAEFTDETDLRIVRHAVYRFHAVVVDRWRFGRVLLLGDAAHQMPPFMGQGMCAGIRDTVNLAWKLHAVHRLGASAELLDTYQDERKAHVRSVVANTRAFGRIIGEMDVAAARDRDRRLAAELEQGTAETVRQNFIPRITGGATARDRDTGTPIGAAGDLFPQPWVRTATGETVRMDTVLDEWFTVVTFADADWLDETGLPSSPLLSPRRIDVRPTAGEHRVADTNGYLTSWARATGAVIAVVRPDRHVYGTAADAAEAQRLFGALRSDLDRWKPSLQGAHS